MVIAARLDQYSNFRVASQIDDATGNSSSMTGFGTFYAADFNENVVGVGTTIIGTVFEPYNVIEDTIAENILGIGTGTRIRQYSHNLVSTYNEINEVTLDVYERDNIRNNIILDYDFSISDSYPGSGNRITDLSGFSSHGTIFGAASFGTSSGSFLTLDGVDDHIRIERIPALNPYETTICIWNYGTINGGFNGSVLQFTEVNNNRIFNIHLPFTGPTLYWDAGNASGYDRLSVNITNAQYASKWNYWVFTKNASRGTMRIYRNGSEFVSVTDPNNFIRRIGEPYQSPTRLLIGAYNSTTGITGTVTGYHYGRINSVQIYNQELTPGEIKYKYDVLKTRFPTADLGT